MSIKMTTILIITIFVFVFRCDSASNNPIIYTFPPELPISDTYEATINGESVPIIKTKIGSCLNFGMTSPVNVTITLKDSPHNVVIRPVNAGIKAEIFGNKCTFQLTRPLNLSVEFDGNLSQPLFVFANPELKDPPDKNDPKVRYFEAGKIHEAGEIKLGEGETLYLEGGAVVHGVVRAVKANHVSIRGAGIFDARPRKNKINMLVFRECKNVMLENIMLIDPIGWSIHLSGSENINLSNVRVLGWRGNSDGLDIEYCRNVTVKKCFWRTSDDCIAIKALYPPGITGIPLDEMINPETLGKHKVPRIKGDVIGDITITESVLWNDTPGNAFEIGFELRVDTIRNITLRNCDIIHVIRGAAFSIHNGDTATIEDVLLENIRVEDADELIDIYIGLSIYSDDCPGPYRRSNPKRKSIPKKNKDLRARNNTQQWFVPDKAEQSRFAPNRGRVRNVVVRDMKVTSTPRSPSILSGYDSDHNISGIRFERLTIDGRLVESAKEANIYLNQTDSIEF